MESGCIRQRKEQEGHVKKEALTAEEMRIEALIEALTLEEKIGMIHGGGLFRTGAVLRLGIPALQFSDGPMGVRQEFENDAWRAIGHNDDFVTYLPCNSALASTWNRTLAYEAGKVLGEEARGRGKDVILAPGINIKRSPLCGRNFEYMSEDPYLTGEMAVPLIHGIQESDTAACVKHFALNNQETERLWVETKVSDRAMREIYLPAFQKTAAEGSAYSLMGAYNRYQGEHCCESTRLLNEILRGEWNYDGMVVSDWGAVHDTAAAAKSGLDVEMSVTDNFEDYCMARPLAAAVRNGEIPEELIDRKVRNILRLMLRLHMLDGAKRSRGCYNTEEHRRAALAAARESVVLLKNETHCLPLAADEVKQILVIGDNADRIHSCGGGSAEIKALYEITPLMGIKKLLGGNAEVTFVKGYDAEDCGRDEGAINWQADSLKEKSEESAADAERFLEAPGECMSGRQEKDQCMREKLRLEALALAEEKRFDQVIFIGGQNHMQDLEGADRTDMKLPYEQDRLICDLLAVRPDMIVVLVSGSPVEMPWIFDVQTLLWHWYAGMEGGMALAEVLFGEVNPSGRLPETFPIRHTDSPAHCIGEFAGRETVAYKEGIYVGYRYYDTKKVPVLFPFGYGLSYTDFRYENLAVKVEEKGENEEVLVSLTIKNVGDREGKEVVQLYVGKADSCVDRPNRELKAFDKVTLQAGETKQVMLRLPKEAFAYYNEEQKAFLVEPGRYQLSIGKSVEEICVETEVRL